jgi:hypothetical protein
MTTPLPEDDRSQTLADSAARQLGLVDRDHAPLANRLTTHLARMVLGAFVFTFLISRILVILIMSKKMPDLFFHLGNTHVHHLNYGIFILSFVGCFLIFARPAGKLLSFTALLYGVGLALTFDEFGMWLHLGGSYWQRASFDAVTVVASVLGLIAYAPSFKRFRPHHWLTGILLALLISAFGWLLWRSLHSASARYLPRLQEIEQSGPQ